VYWSGNTLDYAFAGFTYTASIEWSAGKTRRRMMLGETVETPDEIWSDDLLGRRKEAEDLIGYLECVVARPSTREDSHAHVLAVDTSYGQGKTFFLRRLARHMALTHAVAFVDAWTDDLEDEPMVALAATLEKALAPWVEKSPAVEKGLAQFRSKAGRVAKIVGSGLAKRGVGFLITQGAAEALAGELARADETGKDINKDALKGAGTGIVDDVTTALSEATEPSMEVRIARFREGQAAIQDMKAGLDRIVQALVDAGMQLPITIVIDELDRCRPTYAIKLLEEVKHLFDVSGVAFVLGIYGQQLSHSVTAAYGGGFDGAGYLRRFFNRRYALKDAALKPLIEKLLVELNIPANRLAYPPVRAAGSTIDMTEAPAVISAYMTAYNLKARDAFEVMEMLQTCVALTAPHPILLPYILPLIAAHLKDVSWHSLEIVNPPTWKFEVTSGPYGEKRSEIGLNDLAQEMYNAATSNQRELMRVINEDDASWGYRSIAELRFINGLDDSYARPNNYFKLLSTVQRFSSS
jgi:hypothetical protein